MEVSVSCNQPNRRVQLCYSVELLRRLTRLSKLANVAGFNYFNGESMARTRHYTYILEYEDDAINITGHDGGDGGRA